jgi:plasmid stabilization system protein ParE
LTSPLVVKVSRRATSQIEQAAGWWRDNRPAAPGAIREDVALALVLLATQPGIGVPARRTKSKGVRRLTLSRVRYFLYYRVSKGTLEVLALWHTSRGREPRL